MPVDVAHPGAVHDHVEGIEFGLPDSNAGSPLGDSIAIHLVQQLILAEQTVRIPGGCKSGKGSQHGFHCTMHLDGGEGPLST